MKPFFSIIIPTLNEELFIPNLLLDLQNQKLKNFEVIIIDAKSKDKTKAVIKRYLKKLNLTFYQTNKKNVAYQKNYGAEKAMGEYLIFMDEDCKITKSFTQIFEKEIKKRKGLIFYPLMIPEEKTPQMSAIYQFLNFIIDISQKTNNPFSSVGCVCFERNFFNLILGFDEKLFFLEDYNIARKACEWGVRGTQLLKAKFTFSFRRVKKEGKLVSFYKLVVGNFYYFFKGDARKKIFEYNMGGHLYSEKDLKTKKAKFAQFDIKKIKKYIKDLISDIES